MNGIIYFGAQPKDTQTVSEELSSRGINLLRSTPSQGCPQVIREISSPSYTLYENYFPKAVQAALMNTYCKFEHKGPSYCSVDLPKNNSRFQRTPPIVWSYPGQNKTPDSISQIRDRYNAVETVSQGKPALSAVLRPDQIATLIKDTSPSKTTPATLTSLNISAYQGYLILHRLAHLYLTINQYSLLAEGIDRTSDFYQKAFQIDLREIQKTTIGVDPEKQYEIIYMEQNVGKIRFNMNLPERDLDKVDYTVVTAGQLPNDSAMYFPFVDVLARDDKDAVLNTIKRYFMGLLGKDYTSATQTYTFLKESMGVIAPTVWGSELSHLYTGIRLAFESGTYVRVLVTPNRLYQGFCLIGRGYHMMHHGEKMVPLKYLDAQEAFMRASPHYQALDNLYNCINFPDDMERGAHKNRAMRMYDVGKAVREYGLLVDKEDDVRRYAGQLSFVTDQYLSITANNIARVLDAMTDTTQTEELFPLHHLALLERDRRKRLLSAFGATVPSFQVIGGRAMSLTGAFTYVIKEKNVKTTKTTATMYACVVPYAKGCNDLDQTITSQQVLSPVGTPLASRASSKSLLRELGGNNDGGARVLSALRRVCGVNMATTSTSTGKRKAEEEPEEEPLAKRNTMFDW